MQALLSKISGVFVTYSFNLYLYAVDLTIDEMILVKEPGKMCI